MWIELGASGELWLLRLARQSLELAVRNRARPPRQTLEPAAVMLEQRACFVTLEKARRLRGCIGSLQADRALFEQVIDKTWGAALNDPRFPPVDVTELATIDIELSILDRPQEVQVSGIDDLSARLRPGLDGLILREGSRQSTFLPSVWEKLPRCEEFIAELQRKGGWQPGYWSAEMRASVYRVHRIAESAQ